jgi:ABC-type transport system involved in Fe-S cluster assembly fused permease/ATPase subunit
LASEKKWLLNLIRDDANILVASIAIGLAIAVLGLVMSIFSQKLRVLYKKPQLLILDEATSGLDRNTEKFVMNLLRKLKSEISILFISHRLNTLKNVADSIYILEDGKINHSGNLQQLLLSENIYSQYWLEMA